MSPTLEVVQHCTHGAPPLGPLTSCSRMIPEGPQPAFGWRRPSPAPAYSVLVSAAEGPPAARAAAMVAAALVAVAVVAAVVAVVARGLAGLVVVMAGDRPKPRRAASSAVAAAAAAVALAMLAALAASAAPVVAKEAGHSEARMVAVAGLAERPVAASEEAQQAPAGLEVAATWVVAAKKEMVAMATETAALVRAVASVAAPAGQRAVPPVRAGRVLVPVGVMVQPAALQ
mmetsp:Transcript_1281/g.2961  ORF Transcript_1281/g.2961 Transcript_1281/m.2961 type:complete len:230 (+) Transcript_1281:114-803(+)